MAPFRESVPLRAGATIALLGIAAVCIFLLLSRPDYRARPDPAAIRPLEGHAYGMLLPRSTRLLYELVSDSGTANRSELNLLEDGAPLGPAHSLHDAVRRDADQHDRGAGAQKNALSERCHGGSLTASARLARRVGSAWETRQM